MSFYLLSAPVVAYFLLKQNRHRLNQEQFQSRFGSLYQNLRPEDFRAVFVCILFFARRLIYTFSIVFLGSAPLLQAMIQVVCSMFLIMYTLISRPYIEKEIFYFELFNEMTLLSCSYFLIVFCDILMDYDKRMSVGWYMTVVTLFNILANWLNMVLSVIASLCKMLGRKCDSLDRAQKHQAALEVDYNPDDDNKHLESLTDLKQKNPFDDFEEAKQTESKVRYIQEYDKGRLSFEDFVPYDFDSINRTNVSQEIECTAAPLERHRESEMSQRTRQDSVEMFNSVIEKKIQEAKIKQKTMEGTKKKIGRKSKDTEGKVKSQRVVKNALQKGVAQYYQGPLINFGQYWNNQ